MPAPCALNSLTLRGRHRGTGRGALANAGLILLVAATPGFARTIDVTTTADVVADDGLCSLREAISAVNGLTPSGSLPGECPAGDEVDDTVELPSGRYVLELLPAGEDANAGGDLDITRSVTIRGDSSRSIVENRLGTRLNLGDGDRVFHVDPSAGESIDTSFIGLRIKGGDVSCTGQDCNAGAGAIHALGRGSLYVAGCVIEDNATSCSGVGCGQTSPEMSAGGIAHGVDGDLTIVDTLFKGNSASCEDPDCFTGEAALTKISGHGSMMATVVLRGVTFFKNIVECSAADCDGEQVIDLEGGSTTISDVTVDKNRVSCVAESCDTDEILDVTAFQALDIDTLLVTRNRVSCGGEDCTQDAMVELEGDLGLTIANSSVSRNKMSCALPGCDTDSFLTVESGGPLVADFVELSSNKVKCVGESCDVDRILEIDTRGSVSVGYLDIRSNKQKCRGAGCTIGEAARIDSDDAGDGVGDIEVRGCSLVGNKAVCSGGMCTVNGPMVARGPSSLIFDENLLQRNKTQCKGDGCAARLTGGLYVNVPTVSMTGSYFADNRTSGVGGAVSVFDDVMAMTISGTTFIGNQSGSYGGAIVSAGTIDEIAGCSFLGNTARIDGGGIANVGTVGTIRNTTFSGNMPGDCVNLDSGAGCPGP